MRRALARVKFPGPCSPPMSAASAASAAAFARVQRFGGLRYPFGVQPFVAACGGACPSVFSGSRRFGGGPMFSGSAAPCPSASVSAAEHVARRGGWRWLGVCIAECGCGHPIENDTIKKEQGRRARRNVAAANKERTIHQSKNKGRGWGRAGAFRAPTRRERYEQERAGGQRPKSDQKRARPKKPPRAPTPPGDDEENDTINKERRSLFPRCKPQAIASLLAARVNRENVVNFC